jgi:HEAT repeat protein
LRPWLAPALALGLLVTVLGPVASATPGTVSGEATEGGMHRGPNGRVPPGLRRPEDPGPIPLPPVAPPDPTPPPDEGGSGKPPRAAGRRAELRPITFDSWEFWWGYNKDSILGLRSAFARVPGGEEDPLADRVLPVLGKILDDRSLHLLIRVQAVLALGKLGGSQPAVAPLASRRLRAIAADEADPARRHAALALGLLPRDDAEARRLLLELIRGRRGADLRVRCHAAIALGLLSPQKADPDHEAIGDVHDAILAGGAERYVRLGVLLATGLSGNERRAPVLLGLVRQREFHDLERSHATLAFGRLATVHPELVTKESVRAVERVLERGELHTRRSAAIALGQMGTVSGEFRERIGDVLLRSSKTLETQAACFALIGLGRVAAVTEDEAARKRFREHLVFTLRKGAYPAKPYAALAIGQMGAAADDRTVARLRKSLREWKGDPRQRAALPIALALLEDREIQADLVRILEARREDRTLRGACALALGRLGGPKAVDRIGLVLRRKEDRDRWLHLHTTTAAAVAGDTGSVPEIFGILADEHSSFQVKWAAGLALASLADLGVVDALAKIALDEDASVLDRAAALAALGKLAHRSDRPAFGRVLTDLNYRASFPALDEIASH